MRVGIEDDGGLIVTDKQTGTHLRDLHHFFDVEDTGDEYTFCRCRRYSQTIQHGWATSRIARRVRPDPRVVPRGAADAASAGLTEDRKRRSDARVAVPIVSEIRVYAGMPGVHIVTEVNNRARDHKLTVNFPTGLHVEHAHVDASYMVAERALALPDSTGWVEDPTPLMHQRAFTDLSDETRGLAILNRGLPSVEVTENGTIALTLLRAVGWLSRDDLWVPAIAAGPLVPTPGAQCLGTYRYEYAILPHAGDWRGLPGKRFNAPHAGPPRGRTPAWNCAR